MIVDLSNYNLVLAQNLDHALEMMSIEDEKWTPIAGGTDLMVVMRSFNLPHGNYLSIWDLDDLVGIEAVKNHLMIRAATTFGDIKNHPIVSDEFPLLAKRADLLGAKGIQNRATIGGNIINASPAADSLPPLLCYDAELELQSKKNSRWVPLSEFYSGYKQIEIRNSELLTRIRLPRRSQSTNIYSEYYRKVGARKAQAISKVSFAARACMIDGKIDDIRIALGSVAPYAIRATGVEKVLAGKKLSSQIIKKATDVLHAQITPIDDIRSNKLYRMKVSINLLQHFLENL